MEEDRLIVRTLAATSIVAVIVAAGCGSADATKAGKVNGPSVLRMASRDAAPSADLAAAYFVRRVARVSGGSLRITVVPAFGAEKPDSEQRIVRAVAAGKVDLAAVGTRVLDTLGVRSFQPLTAPMLIDTYLLERAVLASGLPRRMLEALQPLDVTGLAILGEGLRKPVAVRRPLLGPRDWRGITFASFRSRGAAAAIRALGAHPADAVAGGLIDALARGRVGGTDNDLVIYRDTGRSAVAPYVTVNVSLWPRTEVLLASPDGLVRLTTDERAWLRRAAADAASRSTGLYDHDDRIAAELCRSGAHLADASRVQLAALRRAFAPVYRRLERDAQTKAFIERIEQLKRSMPREPPLALPPRCGR